MHLYSLFYDQLPQAPVAVTSWQGGTVIRNYELNKPFSIKLLFSSIFLLQKERKPKMSSIQKWNGFEYKTSSLSLV